MKDDYITMLNGQIATLNQQVNNLTQFSLKYEKLASQSSATEQSLKAKDMIIMALQCDIEGKIVQIEDNDKELAAAQREINELKEHLVKVKSNSFSKELGNGYYPAVDTKNKMFVTLRFLKNRFNEYGLEKYNSKERAVQLLDNITLSLKEGTDNYLIIKQKGKKIVEIYETEFAQEILNIYLKYLPT
jgi:flagellin-like hook-associated protein FlgL